MVWRNLDPFGWGLYEIVPGFVVAFVLIVVFTLLGPRPSGQMEADFDAVREDAGSRT